MHTSEDIFWRPFRKVRKRIIPIRPYRASSIAINCLNMSGDTVKKNSLTNRYTAAVSRIRNLSLRLSWRGLISRRLLAEAVLPEPLPTLEIRDCT